MSLGQRVVSNEYVILHSIALSYFFCGVHLVPPYSHDEYIKPPLPRRTCACTSSPRHPLTTLSHTRTRGRTHTHTHTQHRALWDTFAEMHTLLTADYCLSLERIKAYEGAARKLCEIWVATGDTGAGQFGTVGHIPPYMHCAYKHVPRQLRVLGTLRIVTCQGMYARTTYIFGIACA